MVQCILGSNGVAITITHLGTFRLELGAQILPVGRLSASLRLAVFQGKELWIIACYCQLVLIHHRSGRVYQLECLAYFKTQNTNKIHQMNIHFTFLNCILNRTLRVYAYQEHITKYHVLLDLALAIASPFLVEPSSRLSVPSELPKPRVDWWRNPITCSRLEQKFSSPLLVQMPVKTGVSSYIIMYTMWHRYMNNRIHVCIELLINIYIYLCVYI